VLRRSRFLRCTREAAGMCGAGLCVGSLVMDVLRTECVCRE
jgi:hypothetical protein